MADVILRMSGVVVAFGGQDGQVAALHDVNCEVRDGEFVCLLGPSGCGKSTALLLFAGLLTPSRGSVEAFGKAVRGPHQGIGLVQQQDNLYPWRTLAQNVEFGLELRGLPRSRRQQIARDWIEKVGLQDFGRSYPHQLSGGMKQRANIARTLAVEPRVLLMDEPFGALDAMTRAELQMMLQELWYRLKKTVLFVTHDLVEAITLADRILVMSTRPGTIRAIEDVPLERLRDPYSIQEQPLFAEVHRRLVHHIRGRAARRA